MQWLLLFILVQLIQRIVFLCVCFNGLLPIANRFDQIILIKKDFAYKANIYLYHIFKQTTFGKTSFLARPVASRKVLKRFIVLFYI
jgi:hypothetical protein